MSVGKVFTVTVAYVDDSGLTAKVESLDLLGTYSYNAGDVSKVTVQRDDRNGFYDAAVLETQLDRYVVKFFWIEGEEPDVSTYTVANFLADALAEIALVYGD